ncbi:MAG: hypothetical protein HFJ12_00360 [Bacilli bacterium]|nr:hypothetical protein [Bacilli bacterium]
MKKEILDFYLKTSVYTNYYPFEEYYKSLPDDMGTLTNLLHHQVIHRSELIRSYLNSPSKYDSEIELKKIKEEFPWYRNRCDDDILLTAPAITAELFRQDPRGFVIGREIKDKVVITCRYVSVLLTSILKAKGIPARCRSGYADYFLKKRDHIYYDHWIVQYYNGYEKRWVNVDSDNDYKTDFDQCDIPNNEFKWIAQVWLDVREGKDNHENYIHGRHLNGLDHLAYALFFDFHALMNDEISYLFFPTMIDEKKEFFNLSEENLQKLDELARLMLDPDKNFDELRYLFRNDKWLRVINTPLLGDEDHLELEEADKFKG